MAISFPSKTGKKRSLLIDALRILAWEEFRATNKDELKDLEYGGYAVFDNEWKDEEIHNFTYQEIVDFAKGLEFSENDLLNHRANYYAKKSASNNRNGNGAKANRNADRNGYAADFDNGDLF